MNLTCRYAMRPTSAQYRWLAVILEMTRLLYNAALEERIGAWKKAGKSITCYDQYKSLTEIRADDPDGLGALPATLGRWPLKQVDLAFKAFFSRVKRKSGKAGFPRFRGRAGWRSFGFIEFSGIRLQDDRLLFAGMSLRLRMHRPLPADAAIKSAVFTFDGRHWAVSLNVETASVVMHERPDEMAGLDWGVEKLATLSTGETVENRRFGRNAAAESGAVAARCRAPGEARGGASRRRPVCSAPSGSSPTGAAPTCTSAPPT